MKNLLRAALLSAMLFLGARHAAAQVAIGIQIEPPPPRHYTVPAPPGPDYLWIDGYWYPVNGHYRWHGGYWSRPPYPGAHWPDLASKAAATSTATGEATTGVSNATITPITITTEIMTGNIGTTKLS